MKEERVFIQAGEVKIEGLVDNAPGEKAVIVTHPHPLYGGDMSNNVVESCYTGLPGKGLYHFQIQFQRCGAK